MIHRWHFQEQELLLLRIFKFYKFNIIIEILILRINSKLEIANYMRWN